MGTSNSQALSQPTIDAEQSKVLWQAIKRSLEAKRDQVYEEIHNYRPPIPACDVQFNFLLEERSRVFQELSRFNSLAKQNLPAGALLPLLDEFLLASTCINAETKQRLRAELGVAAEENR